MGTVTGANLLGGLSDSVGRRRMLQTSMCGGLVGYLCLALAVGRARSLPLLLCSRLPIGLLKQSLAVSRALAVDCTSPATRMRAMTKLGAVVGTGFIVGPACGGILSKKVALTAPPFLAAALFAAALLVVTAGLPETAPVPLTASELRRLLASARRRWSALGAQPFLNGGVALERLTSGGECRALVDEWAPHGAPLDEAQAAA